MQSNISEFQRRFYSFFMALPWSSLLVLELGALSHDLELILVALAVGMAATGTILLSAVPPVALVYMSIILIPSALKCLSLSQEDTCSSAHRPSAVGDSWLRSSPRSSATSGNASGQSTHSPSTTCSARWRKGPPRRQLGLRHRHRENGRFAALCGHPRFARGNQWDHAQRMAGERAPRERRATACTPEPGFQRAPTRIQYRLSHPSWRWGGSVDRCGQFHWVR